MRRLLSLKLALAAALIGACVTVNVYFPAAAAEQAADQIIDTVTGQSGGQSGGQPSGGSNDSGARPGGRSGGGGAHVTKPEADRPVASGAAHAPAPMLLVAMGRVLEVLIPAAHAQANANLDISSPEIRAVTGSMQQRFGQLEKYFASGAVGLTADGLVEIRDQNAIPLAERATVKRLVAEDNRDRGALYTEIAKANGHPEWEADIRRIFARRWVERGAQAGWYYQDAGGAWKQK